MARMHKMDGKGGTGQDKIIKYGRTIKYGQQGWEWREHGRTKMTGRDRYRKDERGGKRDEKKNENGKRTDEKAERKQLDETEGKMKEETRGEFI